MQFTDSTQNLKSNHTLYNIASALCDPLQSNANVVLKHSCILRIALAALAFYATFGIATIIASAYVQIQDQNFLDAHISCHARVYSYTN